MERQRGVTPRVAISLAFVLAALGMKTVVRIPCLPSTAGHVGMQTNQPSLSRSPETPESPLRPSKHQLTAEDLAAFLDGYMPGQIERQDIAGAVVIVVKDGEVLYGHGYGFADVAKKQPVSVDQTLFRPGSVSKLFTCTAVMQLVEQAKLDLDRDVNQYLDFKIPETFPEPITLRRIMTHTAGFEEWNKELFVSTGADMEPMVVAMREHLPRRIFAPGTMPAYSNYAMSLAGYIVQRVSGEGFEDYVSNHILRPLEMSHTSFLEPLPSDLASLMSSGYELGSGNAKDFEFVNGIPAGSMSVSASDIARFMIAHLQDGRFGKTQILRPDTARLMHARAFGLVPELNGMALGFFEENENGLKIIGHGGDTQYFHSHLYLILDANTGLFLSMNSLGRSGGDIRAQLWHKFLNRYFPGDESTPPAISTAAQDARTVAGNYISSRRGDTTIMKILALLDETKFSVNTDNTISSPDFLKVSNQPRHWREIGPLVYRDEASQAKLAFRRNAVGELEVFSDWGAFGGQRASTSSNGDFFVDVLYCSAMLLALNVLLWPVGALLHWRFKNPLKLGKSEKHLRLWTRFVCALDVAIGVAWFEYFNYVLNPIGRESREFDWALNAIHLVQLLAIAGTLIPILYTFRVYFGAERRRGRVFVCLPAIACVSFVWLIYICNLIHFDTKY